MNGLSTLQVARATGLTYRQLDSWVRLRVITPRVQGVGSGSVRRWAPDQVRVLRLLATLRTLGAQTATLTTVAVTAEALEGELGRAAWSATMLVTLDGRMVSPLSCNENGYLVRLDRCRDLAADVQSLAARVREAS